MTRDEGMLETHFPSVYREAMEREGGAAGGRTRWGDDVNPVERVWGGSGRARALVMAVERNRKLQAVADAARAVRDGARERHVPFNMLGLVLLRLGVALDALDGGGAERRSWVEGYGGLGVLSERGETPMPSGDT